MSLSLERAKSKLLPFKVDKKGEDGDRAVSVDLKLEVKVSADILAEFHPSLRAALFTRENAVRFPSMEAVAWQGTRRDMELRIRPGPDLKPAIEFDAVTCRGFKLKPWLDGAEPVVTLTLTAAIQPLPKLISILSEYIDEDVWIDVHGGGELDLAPPSARTEIPELDGMAVVTAPGGPPITIRTGPVLAKYDVVNEIHVAAVRRLQASPKGAQAKLKAYPDEVLRAAIAAESAAANCRPMFVSMLEAEIKRRHETH